MKTSNRCALAALVCVGCAGADGADGTDGARGKAGEAPEITTQEASEEDCPGGGSEVTIGEEAIVICNGEDGADGADGMDGEDGAPGTDGVDATAGESIGMIEASLYCGAQLEGEPFWFRYFANEFSDGSVWVSAGIYGTTIEASGSRFFAPTQIGADTAQVTVTLDAFGDANAGFWVVELDRETLTVIVSYTDADVADGELTWTLDSDSANCVVNEY